MRLAVSPGPQPPQIFTARGFEAFFPGAGTLGCAVCLTPWLFLLAYLYANVGPPSLPTTAFSCLAASSRPQLPVSTSPTGLDECFFFKS